VSDVEIERIGRRFEGLKKSLKDKKKVAVFCMKKFSLKTNISVCQQKLQNLIQRLKILNCPSFTLLTKSIHKSTHLIGV